MVSNNSAEITSIAAIIGLLAVSKVLTGRFRVGCRLVFIEVLVVHDDTRDDAEFYKIKRALSFELFCFLAA